MDFQAVGSPTNYGAPNVFQQPAQGQQGQSTQQSGQPNISGLLAKAKSLLSSGQISPDQYSQIAQQAQQLQYSAGNMGSTMPGSPGAQTPGQPLNILPGAGS